MALITQGTPLFRAKWTAKEVYIHVRAFGYLAGVRYVGMRLREVQQRGAKPWRDGGPVSAGMDATLLIGAGPDELVGAGLDALAWDRPVLKADADPRGAATFIPLARTVVFAGSPLPQNVRALLQACRTYRVSVVYVYGPTIAWRDRRAHNQVLRQSQTAVYASGGGR